MTQQIRIESDDHWHALRRQHIGGSEVAALFGEHPRVTRYELWNRKKERLPDPDLSDNERVFWGTILEPAIAQGVGAKTGWTIRKVRRYFSRRPELALGASLDYEIVAHDRGPGVLEIKTADWLIVRAWEDGEPPLSYELQLQSYLACTGRSWGCIGVLVGGNELRLFEYDRRPRTVAAIEAEVATFWRSIEEDKPPKPDWEKDGVAVSRLYSEVMAGKTIDLGASNRVPELIANYQAGAAQEKAGKTAKDAAKAELLTLIGDAERATCGDFTISCKTVAGAAIAYERKPYRDFRVNERKAKAA
jgi:putative phage-type endonuclease